MATKTEKAEKTSKAEAESITLHFKKETPGTFVYENRDSETLTAIYIKRGAKCIKGKPERIRVT
ncbi:MAG TPA: hypothetical protein VEF04_01690, partial [Blastocatellia bacterium]|nr:hypothetical protein [Blastocatellia bacterium]